MCYHAPSGETEVLKNFSLVVGKNEFVSLVGPSGCGKSTLLSLAAGLLKPDSGEVSYLGKRIDTPPHNMGYMLQRDELFPWLNILDNALIGLKVRREVTRENIEYVKELLNSCSLSGFMHAFPRELSGGMRQRVALVRTLAVRPDFLLLDEPFSALDAQTRLKLSDEVGQLIRQQNTATLLVTHDRSEAVSLSSKVIVLSRRPAQIKRALDITFASDSAIERRSDPQFRHYFEEIWSEVDVHVE
jgi:NitT/TauT family transport system ATP-binding protein